MSEGRLGMVIVGAPTEVKGVVTDGDLRRALVKTEDTTKLNIAGIMTRTPVIVNEDEYISQAEQLMIEKKIVTLLVGSAAGKTVKGIYQIYNG